MAETSLEMETTERDDDFRRTQVSSPMEARQAVDARSTDSDVDLTWTQAQVETQMQRESPLGHKGHGETLESQLNTQRNRRRFLRQVQKDMVSSINAYAVVLVLLASVTFVGFLQPPGALDDVGHLRRHGGRMKTFIMYIFAAFYLAVVGILVCMSCIAFVLPHATTYAGRSLIAERKPKYSSVGAPLGAGLNSDAQNNLVFEVKTNDKMSRILKVAHIHEILANLFFVMSLLSTVNAFLKSAEIVIDGEEFHTLTSQTYWKIIENTFEVLFFVYIIILLLNIVIAGKDLVVDLLKTVKRLPFKSVLRLGSSRTIL